MFRFWLINKFNLSPDECYYWEWSRNIDISYMDQGPVLGWLIFLSTKIFGNNEFGVRFPAVSFGLLGLLLLYLLSKEFFQKNKNITLILLLLFNSIPLISLGTMIMTHDIPLSFFWITSFLFLYKLINTDNDLYYYPLSISMALMILSKYTAILFFPCAFTFFLTSKKIPKISKHLYFSLIIFLCLCSLPIIWNIKHDFPTLKYLTGPVVFKPYGNLNLYGIIEYLVGQILLVSPFIFLAVILTVINYQTIFSYFSVPVLIFFGVYSLIAKTESNWTAFAYPLLLIPTAKYLYDLKKKLFRVSTISLGLTICVLTLIQTFLPFLPFKIDPMDEKIRGWKQLGIEISKIKEKYPKCIFISDYYWIASEIAFYTQNNPRVQCFDFGLPLRQYSMWSNLKKYHGSDALFITSRGGFYIDEQETHPPHDIKQKLSIYFDSVELLKVVRIEIRKIGKKKLVKCFYVFYCKNLKNV